MKITKRIKVKKEYKFQFCFSVIGGIILIFVGAVGSAIFYENLAKIAVDMGFLSESTAYWIILFFETLALLGGITVIIGGIIIGFLGKKSLGNFFIGIGAGVSIGALIIRLISIGPVIRYYFINAEYVKILVELGFGIGLHGLGTLLAFLAILRYYKPLMIGFIDGLILTIAGVIISPEDILAYINAYITISPEVESVLLTVFAGISLAGTVMMIDSLIYGAGHIKIGKIITLIVLLVYMPQYIPMILSSKSYEMAFTHNTLSFALSTIAIIFLIVLLRYTPPKKGKIKIKKKKEKKKKEKNNEVA